MVQDPPPQGQPLGMVQASQKLGMVQDPAPQQDPPPQPLGMVQDQAPQQDPPPQMLGMVQDQAMWPLGIMWATSPGHRRRVVHPGVVQ